MTFQVSIVPWQQFPDGLEARDARTPDPERYRSKTHLFENKRKKAIGLKLKMLGPFRAQLRRTSRTNQNAKSPLQRRADDGLDGPALPGLPPAADASCAALYGDADHGRDHSRRSGAAARV